MPRLLQSCPICSKNLELDREENFLGEKLKFFKCGHAFSERKLSDAADAQFDFFSIDRKKQAYEYQKTGVHFIYDANYSCILGDQMRLGKTPTSLLALKNAPRTPEGENSRIPCLILVRAANLWQWMREIKSWYSSLPAAVWIIDGTKSWIPPGFDIYLMSMDTFGRRGTCQSCKHQFHDEECTICTRKQKTSGGPSCRVCIPAGDAMSDRLLEFGFKLVIVDEAHSFKNTDSQRSQALTAFLRTIERSDLVQEINFQCPKCTESWKESVTIKIDSNEASQRVSKKSTCPKCFMDISMTAAAHVKVTRNCGVVMLTGTAVKNRADEYFVPLNLVNPQKFPSLGQFQAKWLIADGKGKYSRVAPAAYQAFKTEIAPYVLRREKQDIYQDVPAFNRIFTILTIDDEKLKKAYNKVIDELENEMVGKPNLSYFDSIGQLQRLRQICGLAKVNWVADYADDFLAGNECAKLAIGYHHHSVRDALAFQLEKYAPCKLDGMDSPQQKDYIAHKYFEKSEKQLILLGEQACKEGMELVYIENALVTERQWNAADEEQFEYRFYNPSKSYLKSRGLENKITTVEFPIAKGTIDEFFYDLVEEKRSIMGETLGQEWSVTKDEGSFRQLLERTVAGRL